MKDDPKKSVIFSIPDLKTGGAERFFCNLFNSIDDNYFDKELVLGSNSGDIVDDIKEQHLVSELKATRSRNAIIPAVKKN